MRNLMGKMKNFRRKYRILEESAMILIFPTEIQNKTKFWSVQLGKPLDFGLCFGPPPSTWDRVKCGCYREEEGSFFSLREAYVLSFSLLLCLEPCKKFSVGGWWWWSTVNLVFCFGPKLWFWTWTKLNNYLYFVYDMFVWFFLKYSPVMVTIFSSVKSKIINWL